MSCTERVGFVRANRKVVAFVPTYIVQLWSSVDWGRFGGLFELESVLECNVLMFGCFVVFSASKNSWRGTTSTSTRRSRTTLLVQVCILMSLLSILCFCSYSSRPAFSRAPRRRQASHRARDRRLSLQRRLAPKLRHRHSGTSTATFLASCTSFTDTRLPSETVQDNTKPNNRITEKPKNNDNSNDTTTIT